MNSSDMVMSLMREGIPITLLVDLALGVSHDQLRYDDTDGIATAGPSAVAR